MKWIFLCLVFWLYATNAQGLEQGSPEVKLHQTELTQSKVLKIPDPQIYKSFLLSAWNKKYPSLIVFKDPSCPYCIRDLKKRQQLSKYNVFLFWAPILGTRSVEHVNSFFKCASSSEDSVLEAVIKRDKPGCSGLFNKTLFDLNNEMVKNYDPHSVPQYWLGGRQVSLANLDLSHNKITANSVVNKSTISVSWPRYQSSAINEIIPKRHNIGIVLPEAYALSLKELRLIANNSLYNWYLFGAEFSAQIKAELGCKRHVNSCSSGVKDRTTEHNNLEFRLLTGLEKISEPQFSLEGKILLELEKKQLIPKEILAALSN